MKKILTLTAILALCLSFVFPVTAFTNLAEATTTLPCDLNLSYQTASVIPTSAQYQLSVLNQGSGTCRDTSLSFYYTDGETFVSAIPQSTAAGYYWSIGSLTSGQTFNLQLTTAHSTNQTQNEACAAASNGMDSCANYEGMTSQQPPVIQAPTVPTNTTGEYGIWFWDSPAQMTDVVAADYLDKIRAQGFNTVYVTIDDYLDRYALAKGTKRDNALKAYSVSLARFITVANSKGISVDAEAGAWDWVNPDNSKNASIILQYAADFNRTHEMKLRGVQYDIEPYLLTNYESNKASVLQSFVTLVDGLVQQNKTLGMRLGIVIPHFYDSVNQWTPSFVYNGVTAYAFTHLLNLLDTSPNSTLLVMAYRNTANGNNSTTTVSQDEIKEASTGHTTKVIIAQEVGNVDPGYVTFYGTSYNYFLQQVEIIKNNYKKYGAFSGIAVNYLDPFLQLVSSR